MKAAADIYEKLVADSLHLGTYAELGGIYRQLGQYKKAVRVFDAGLALADGERIKAKQKMPHQRIFSAKLVHYKLSYALPAHKNEHLQQARQMLSSVIEEYSPDKTGQAGVQLTGTYGQVPQSLLAECHFVLGTLYGKSHDGVNARFHLNKSAELGKKIPEQLENFMKAEGI